ncbi:DeoR/GlpR family DNA-binding transcription regulator [Enterococcus sp. AZ109]|uniref:DeoR/GlpR family DNA-binding transcription regulator n=1 Tax=Enterococcus sp. AZ109 TaxID=2774634 RepID=UPI003F25D389
MYQEERIQKIQQLLLEKNRLTKNEIMEQFNISSDTARRDILAVTQSGLATRTHGGIMLADTGNKVLDFFERSNLLLPEKEKMAKKVVDYLPENSVCFLDVSTTLSLAAQQLKKQCKVYTHSLDNAFALGVNSLVTTHVFGGELDTDNRFFFGTQTSGEIQRLKFDLAFIGAASIEPDGIYFKEETNAYVKQAVVSCSRKVVLVSEHQKFLKSAPYKGADLAQIDVVVTDCELSLEEQGYFKQDCQFIY